ncbi:MAG: winged helix DNA-binding domain-containing protein, partial [Thermoleophilaceae bacterium]|nr:winged helix DNA-binding domain-containing protein [Thermoleophilaceae bacterium]
TLVRDYLAAFGPASAADVQAFTGLGAMKSVLKAMGDELEILTDESGRELFDLPGAPLPDADVPAPPRFLPEFDSLVLAHKDRSRLLPDEHKGKIVTKNLRVRATFLWEGAVSGTWRIERRKQVATLEIAPFAKLPKGARKALAEEGEALVRFAEEDAESLVVKFDT